MNANAYRLFAVVLVAVWVLGLGSTFTLPHLIALTDRGDFLIRNTVRLALLYWAIAVMQMLRPRSRSDSEPRLAWTLGCIAYLIHVGMAFHYAHHWSHAEAFNHVQQVGSVGAGIFVSYFFTLLWTLDVIWWWLNPNRYENRARWISWSIHGFLVFMIVNGAIIFESGAIRWVGAAVLLGLVWRAWHRMNETSHADNRNL
jgi:hypothetical protein